MPNTDQTHLRQILQHPGDRGLPYVMVVHNPTMQGFALDRQYHLCEPQDYKQICSAIAKNKEFSGILNEWLGWFPTQPHQIPSWATSFVDMDTLDRIQLGWTAYWIYSG